MRWCRLDPAPDSPAIQIIHNLAPYTITAFLNPPFCLRIQLIDKVSESRNFFSNSQIAISLGFRRRYAQTAQIKINRHDFSDLRKLLDRIDLEVLKPQRERGGLQIKLSFLNKFR